MNRIGAMFQRNELAVGSEPVVVPPCVEIGGQNKTLLPSFPFSNDEIKCQDRLWTNTNINRLWNLKALTRYKSTVKVP